MLVLETADAAFGSGRFADRFYDALFAKAPETRALFGADVAALKLKFMNMLISIVGNIQHPELFGSIITHLGRQHRQFGVQPAHYEPVGAALLATLHDILSERFTPEVREAWAALYDEIAEQMQEGARSS